MPSKAQLLAASDRDRIDKKLQAAKRLCKHIKVLRHNKEAHVSSFLGMPNSRTHAAARTEILGFLSECRQVFQEITLAAYPKWNYPFPDFEKEIGDDLKVFLTLYSRLRGVE